MEEVEKEVPDDPPTQVLLMAKQPAVRFQPFAPVEVAVVEVAWKTPDDVVPTV